ncbi:MAG: MATE family efflux transporter [Clostridiaceae bacterium]|jgi:putative MATE family efflux protein|nr:MATE family efflux transporter [Bacillota bacterium]NLN52248.1 MATE family efflux transporter [Clostridiaceae bacterium]
MIKKVRSFFSAQDLTEGNILQGLLRFSIPLIIGNFAQQLYSTVDSIVVGRAVPGGLAAIGATFPIINFTILLFMAIATGAGVMVAQYFGAKDQNNLTKTVGNTLLLIFIATVILISITIPLSRPILSLINTPADIIDMATSYLKITFLGFLGAAYFNIGSGILRGVGDSITPLIYLLISTVLNTGLDILFVWQFNWGVAGAAWATIISQVISAILVLSQIYRTPRINRLQKDDIKPDLVLIKRLLILGLPAGITQGLFSLAMIMVQNLTNKMGTMIVEANIAVIRLDGFAMMPNQTFGMAATTFIGQNIGAKNMERVKRGSKVVTLLALVVSFILSMILLIFGRQLLGLFSTNPRVIEIGYNMMLILIVGYIAISQTITLGGVMRGAGDTMTPMWITLFVTVFLRVPLAYFLTYLSVSPEWPNGSPYMQNIALLAAWILGAIITLIFYRRGKWQDKAII